MPKDIHFFLNQVAKLAAVRLAEWLPLIGGDNWWKFYVYHQLSVPQQKSLAQTEGSISELDPAAVFRVLSRNWRELSNHPMTGLKASGFKYAKEALDIRNELAHLPVGVSTELPDALRHADTLKRLAESLQAEPTLLGELELFYREAIVGSVSQGEQRSTKPDSPVSPVLRSNETSSESASSLSLALPPNKDDSTVSKASLVNLTRGTVDKYLALTAYVGIDFGTSTTVVSAVQLNPTTGLTSIQPLSIPQPTEYGDSVEHYLVNSVLTQHRGKLLFGSEAARLKVKHIEGEEVFSSFKMLLGLNLPNRYPNSKVRAVSTGKLIKTPQEVASEFFTFLKSSAESVITSQLKTTSIKYAISVPASFEANQRQDLLSCLAIAGFSIESSSLIDEPNAAFLSYLHDSWQEQSGFVGKMTAAGAKNVLVFDFGAGTCDISVLKLVVNGQTLSSRNLAISRFMALGGDDIDRVIAKKVLLPRVSYSNTSYSPSQEEIGEQIIPWLKAAAEELKIACTDELNRCKEDDFDAARNLNFEAVVEAPEDIYLGTNQLAITRPSLRMADYVDILSAFSSETEFDQRDAEGEVLVGEPKSIIAPVNNAIRKAGLEASDIHAVLFIGGSAKNPLVRKSVMSVFPPSTEMLIPSNLQAHVSKGAALHCLGHYALGLDFVQPITSEPIFLITRGACLKLVIPAGSPVPSDSPIVETVKIGRAGQRIVELPICVSNENKLLGMLRIEAPCNDGFSKDELVTLACRLTHDKVLEATASIRGITKRVLLTNPLTNNELSESEQLALEARQAFQEALLENKGRPTAAMLLAYAESLKRAENFLEAADHYIQLEALNSSNHATNICFCYAMAGNKKESQRWSKIAYERKPSAVTCYNYALDFSGRDPSKYEELLRQSLTYDAKYAPSLRLLGDLRIDAGQSDGAEYLEKAAEALASSIKSRNATIWDCDQLERLSERLGRDDLIELAQGRKALLGTPRRLFKEENLVASGPQQVIA